MSRTGLTIDSANKVSTAMEQVNAGGDGSDASSAYFVLVDFKQHLIDNEEYEVLVDLHKLEQLHDVAIPFKLRAK